MTEVRQPHRQTVHHEPGLGSPRSPRYSSDAQGVSRTATFQVPSTPGEAIVPPPPGALHGLDGDAFNIDPNVPYLESGGISPGQGRAPISGRVDGKKFVGGFVVGMKRILRGYRRDNSRRLEDGTHHIDGSSRHYTHPAVISPDSSPTMSPGSTHSYSSPPTSSETAYETQEGDLHDGETTAVDHEMFSPHAQTSSPVLVEPQPGPDYAKMDSPTPPPSDASFRTYMSRVQKFFHDLNELPWVADRVTVDYFPGQSKRRARPRPAHRPVVSWYNNHPGHQASIDLLSGSSSPSTLPMHQVHQLSQSRDIPIAGITYATNGNNNAVPVARTVPGVPTYPNGYVSYREQDAAAAQYPELSVHMAQVPPATANRQTIYSQYPYPVPRA